MPPTGDPAPALRTDPALGAWPGLARDSFASLDGRAPDPAIAAAARVLRGELGVPTDRPVVMTGHQAELWHGGIFAKYAAAGAAARAAGGAAAWVVADQDQNDHASIRLPVRTPAGHLAARVHRFGSLSGAVTGRREPMEPVRVPDALRSALPGDTLRARVGVIEQTLAAHRHAPSAAEQIARTLADLLLPHVDPAPTVFATRLGGSSLFGALAAALADDPVAAARAYNTAAADEPSAGVTPLHIEADAPAHTEVPAWVIDAAGHRRRALARDLAPDALGPRESLAPRALLMTLMLRVAACDLFVHGTGGAAYDRVTERWAGAWLGARLAPAALATADVRLRLETVGAEAGAPPVDRAVWRAHHGRHDPGVIGDAGAAAEKRGLVRSVAAEPRGSAGRAAAFARMHEWLGAYRERAADELAWLDAEVERARSAERARRVLAERAWAFALADPSDLRALTAAAAAAAAGWAGETPPAANGPAARAEPCGCAGAG